MQHELWRHYQQTIFYLSQKSDVQLLQQWQAFSVITPCNPKGKVSTEKDNRKFLKCFYQLLNELGFSYLTIWGCAKDLSHCEQSLAVFCDPDKAMQLAQQYNQNAIYTIEKRQLSLVVNPQSDMAVMPEIEKKPLQLGDFYLKINIFNEEELAANKLY